MTDMCSYIGSAVTVTLPFAGIAMLFCLHSQHFGYTMRPISTAFSKNMLSSWLEDPGMRISLSFLVSLHFSVPLVYPPFSFPPHLPCSPISPSLFTCSPLTSPFPPPTSPSLFPSLNMKDGCHLTRQGDAWLASVLVKQVPWAAESLWLVV